MIVGIGIDLVKLAHFQKKMKMGGNAFIQKVFAPEECNRARQLKPAQRLGYYAKRYAAKEAFVKALGIGFGPIGLQDVWVENMASGQPIIVLSKKAQKFLKNKYKKNINIHVSLSDDKDAVAIVMLDQI